VSILDKLGRHERVGSEGHAATSISNGIAETAGIMGRLLRAIRSPEPNWLHASPDDLIDVVGPQTSNRPEMRQFWPESFNKGRRTAPTGQKKLELFVA